MAALLRRLAGPADTSDVELVRRFRDGRDGDAFADLVRRHGPVVFGVCRRMLPAYHDAEDAFQATFLVLALKPEAASPAKVGAWLHGVAARVCLKARRTAARRLAAEQVVAERAEPPTHVPSDDLSAVLDELLLGLPEKYRRPVVECHLAGRSRKDAAARLGWTEGTLSGRLARALDLLAARLTRRGIGLSAGALAGVLSAGSLRAAVPARLAASTEAVAGLLADGLPVPAGLAALSGRVLNAMWWNTWKAPAAVGLAAGLLLAGSGLLVPNRATADPPAPAAPPAKPAAKGWVTTKTLKRDHPITVLATGPDGVIAAGDEGGNLILWDPSAAADPAVILKGGDGKGLTTSVDRLTVTPDGKYLYAITNGGRGLMRTDLRAKGRPGNGFSAPNPWLVGFSADGEVWLEKPAAADSFLLRTNYFSDPEATAKYEKVELPAGTALTHLAASPDGSLIAVVENGGVHLVERDGPKVRMTSEAPGLAPTAVRFAPDGQRFGVAGENGRAAVYDAAGNGVVELKGLDGIVFAVALSPDGKLVATGGQDHTARIWDAATGKQLAVLKGHTDSVKDVAFGPDGKTLVTGSADKTVRVWEWKQ